ncbi:MULTISPECIES: efflux RND transporter periplasmic adaptor subunit [Erythrobacter]|jgi:biotin carboxyl carrier protein|nr:MULTISPECIES: HlyD family efflux transporter periplasmic adaptor subunit [Erythrobacter]
MATIAAAILLSTPSASYAHGDEDHDAAAVASAPTGAKPRIEARTATIELVAAVNADDMTIWIDGWADNAPITNANVNVTIDGKSQPAKLAGGVYTVSDAKLETAGAHQVAFLITRAGAVESLSAELNVPDVDAATASGGWTYWLAVAGIAVLAVIGLIFWRSRKTGAAIGVLALGLLLLQPRPIQAHGDEDHSAAATTPVTTAPGGGGDTAARLPDGGVFAPKGVQRIIGLRTIVAVDGVTTPTANLTGQIIADPRRGGLVQSATGGRVTAGTSGIAVIGQSVRAGQILAIIEPPLQAIDRASLSRELGDLDQQIALASNRAARLRRLEGVVPRREIEEAAITLRGLQSRRAGLGQATSAREVLRAPISGVISVSGVRVGQVVAAQTTLFEIVDPSRLYVEANLFDRRPIAAGASAVGKTSDGATFDLVFEGAGLADRGRAAQGLFRIVGAPPRLRIDESVTLAAPLGEPVAGVIVPRASLISGSNGLTSVFVKTRAETFALRNVTTAPVDAGHVAILAGVKAEERVVTNGATLLGQVR